MDILFGDRKLAVLCNDSAKASRRFGADCAGRLRRRLDDLAAAPDLEAMRHLPGRCHELKGDRRLQLSLDLVHPLRLVFEPADEPVARKPDGGLDWSRTQRVRILEVVDTHE